METGEEILNKWIEYERIIMLLSRLVLNLIIVSAIVIPKFILKQRKEFAFSLYLFNFVIFALCYVIAHTELGWTAGIGLFAIFAMLRFRSEMLNLLDMTYLLAIISVGFVNAAFNGSISFAEIILLNVGLFSMIYMLDHLLTQSVLKCKKIKYDNLELIKPENKDALINDLSEKTGIKIEKLSIETINLNEENATIRIYYRDDNLKNNTRKEELSIHKFSSIFRQNHILQER